MIYYTILFYTILYYTILYFTIPYYTNIRLASACPVQGPYPGQILSIQATPSPPIKSLGFEGFDSSKLLILKGGNSHVRRIV